MTEANVILEEALAICKKNAVISAEHGYIVALGHFTVREDLVWALRENGWTLHPKKSAIIAPDGWDPKAIEDNGDNVVSKISITLTILLTAIAFSTKEGFYAALLGIFAGIFATIFAYEWMKKYFKK